MTMFYVLESACSQIPCPVFSIAHTIESLIKWAVPIILIVIGMLDFAKATMANDEGDIAKAKQIFIKRLLSGMCVFVIMAVLELVFNVLAASAENGENDGGSVWTCVNQIFNGQVDGGCDNIEYLDQEAEANKNADSETDSETNTEN